MIGTMHDINESRAAKTKALPLCRHCHRLTASKPRGLCNSCYFTPEIRAGYEPETFPRYVPDTGNLPRPLPPQPTRHLPGTEEKIEVMAWRDTNGYQVRHPLDAYYDWNGRAVYPTSNSDMSWEEYRVQRAASRRE